MKVNYGKYVLTRTEAENTLVKLDESIKERQNRLDILARWADAQLKLHVPYISGRIDLSTVNGNLSRKSKFLNSVMDKIYCSECETSWPCNKIDELKVLRSLGKGYLNEEQLQMVNDRIDRIEVKKKENQLGGDEFFL